MGPARIELELSFWSPFNWWIRLNGYGLNVVDHRKHRLSFSERNGLIHPRPLHLGPVCIRILKPNIPRRAALRVVGGE